MNITCKCGYVADGLLDYDNHARGCGDFMHYTVEHCPACGEPIDYCQGHGMIGDPNGRTILVDHDDGEHGRCHPRGCRHALEAHRATMGTDHSCDYCQP